MEVQVYPNLIQLYELGSIIQYKFMEVPYWMHIYGDYIIQCTIVEVILFSGGPGGSMS
jgi:hypothetical protein